MDRDGFGKIHSRQAAGAKHQGRYPIDQRDRQLAAGNQSGESQQRQPRGSQLALRREHERQRNEHRQQGDRPQVEGQGRSSGQPPAALDPVAPRLDALFEFRQASVEQEVADVPAARFRIPLPRVACQQQRGRRHFRLAVQATSREAFHHVSILVARGEVHRGIDACRIVAQHLLDNAHRFDELAPVHRRQGAQAANAVADGHLVGGLLLCLQLHQILDALPGFHQPVFDPVERHRQRGALSLQAAAELGDECAAHRRTRAGHVGHGQHHVLRIALGDIHQLVGPVLGEPAIGLFGQHAGADAAQVLDQRQSQHDRDGPQLAQLQRRDGLVGRYEAAQAFGVHPTVAMRDRLERDVIDARHACRRAARKARQLAAVALGQMPLRRANLFLDQVEVVEQPFGGRRDSSVVARRGGQRLAAIDQDFLVVGQAAEQQVGPATGAQAMLSRQGLAVAFHLVSTE